MASIFDHLREDHQRLRRSLIRLRAAGPGTDPRPIFGQLLREYTAHARAEEYAFYSYLIHIRRVQRRALAGLDEHQRIAGLLAAAERVAPGDPRWKATIDGLHEALVDHLRDEESNLFTLARGALSEREAEQLGRRFVAERARVYRALDGLEQPHALAVGGR